MPECWRSRRRTLTSKLIQTNWHIFKHDKTPGKKKTYHQNMLHYIKSNKHTDTYMTIERSKERRNLFSKTRCSPRTRMQSRRTLVWNKLFEQSCTFCPCYRLLPYQRTVDWNAEEGGVQSVGREESGVLSGNVVCRVWRADCGVWSVQCEVSGGKWEV